MAFQKQHLFFCSLAFLALGLIFFGLKLVIIAHYGSATPYWDQWDMEAANLYKPFFEGTLTLRQLLVPHNEHRILTTRLLALLLVKINGIWNPLLEMVVSAAVYVIAILSILGMLLHALGKKAMVPLLFFALILFAFPYGWDNTVTACNAHFYCVLLFSVLTLFLLIEKKIWSPWWWLGIVSGLLAFFSLASGIFALAAGATVLGIQYFLSIDRSWKKVIGTVALMVLVLLGIAFTPTIAGHASLKAHSAVQFAAAFITTMSWPLPGNFFWFLFRNAPAIILCRYLFTERPPNNDHRWFLLGFVIWTTAQAVSIAYGRVEGCLSSRYLDLFSLSVLINFACLLDQCFIKNIFQKSVVALWAVIVAIALAWYCHKELPHQLAEKKRTEMAQTFNVQNYQRSGDINDLKNKPFQEIPYPDANRLAEILSSPTVQKILPTILQKPSEEYLVKRGRLDSSIIWLLTHAFLFVGLGILMAFFLSCSQRKKFK